MIYSSRAYEHRAYATRRAHLLPVQASTWHKVNAAAFHGPERWWVSLAMFLGLTVCVLVALEMAK